MNMKERLKVHRQIEAENKDRQERWHRRQIVKEFYPLFCKEGRFCEARLLLKLLRNGTITLGLDDESSSIEHLLENIGFKAFYGRNYNTARYTL